MQTHELVVEKRESTGKGAAHKVRATGRIPGIVYGKDLAPMSITLDPPSLRTIMRSSRGLNSVIGLSWGEGQSTVVMIQDYQMDPLSRTVIHVDFKQVTEDSYVIVKIPFHVDGKPEGTKVGGLLQQLARELTVRCRPQDIPVEIRADVTSLNVMESLSVKDVVAPAGCTILYRNTYPVATVIK